MQTFKVKGMTCGHCERAVTHAVQSKDPSADVKVDRAAGTVQVQSTLTDAEVRQAIAEEGYEVQ